MKNDHLFKRIISLAPSITETVFALGLGDYLVGRTEHCDWPEQVAKIPVVGGFATIEKDRILERMPDLVIGTTLHKAILKHAASQGVAVATIPSYPIYAAPLAIRSIGHTSGAVHESDALEQKVENELAQVKKQAYLLPPKMVCYLCNIACPLWYSCAIAAGIVFLNCRIAGRDHSKRNSDITIVNQIVNDKPELFVTPQCSKCRKECIDPLLNEEIELKQYITDKNIPIRTIASTLLARSGPRAAEALEIL